MMNKMFGLRAIWAPIRRAAAAPAERNDRLFMPPILGWFAVRTKDVANFPEAGILPDARH